MDLNEVATFVRVVEAGGFSAAADEMGLPKSTISRRVSRLEKRLGVRLLERTPRRMRLTEAGQAYFDQVAPPIARLREAEMAAEEQQDTPRGTLRLTAPTDFGYAFLAPILAGFVRRYPDIQVEVELTGRVVDMIREGFDVAIRGGELADSSLVARRLGRADFWLFASPAFLEEHGTPERPADLRARPCVLFRASGGKARWNLEGPDGASETVEVRGPISGSDFAFLRRATRFGAGIGFMPSFMGLEDMDRGALVRVLPEWSRQGPGGLHLVYPSARFLPAKVKAFRDYILEELDTSRWKSP